MSNPCLLCRDMGMYLLIGLALLFIGALNAQVRLAWAIRERDPQLWLSLGKPDPFHVFGNAGRAISRFAWNGWNDSKFRIESRVFVLCEVSYFMVLFSFIVAVFLMK